MNICVIGDPDMIVGFRLSGVSAGFPAGNAQEARNALKNALEGNYDLIMISENLSGDPLKDLIKEAYEKGRPIIVEIPSKQGSSGHAKIALQETIRRAIGVSINQEEAND